MNHVLLVEHATRMMTMSIIGPKNIRLGDKIYFNDQRDLGSIIQLAGMLCDCKFELKSKTTTTSIYGCTPSTKPEAILTSPGV